ncbi:MAG TPA: NUDIX domain-containing protein, partial [Flavobacteriaceae bacterium]|nr:NUDIX domain-containing protein [Flavobacteriaceae bacterium]
MYKVFIKDTPIILSTVKNIGKQYTAIPIKDIKFKKLIKDINKGKLKYVNLYHPDKAMLDSILLEKLPVVIAAGGMVYNSKQQILFIKRNNRWDLPKGRVEKNERLEDAAIREVEEETGVKDLELGEFITKTYHVFKRNKKWKLKVTYWYEMHSDYQGKLKPQKEEGIKKVKWKNFEQSQRALKN